MTTMENLKDYTSEDITFKDKIAYLITRTDEEEVQEIFKGCLMIPEADLTPEQKSVFEDIDSGDNKKRFRGIWYMAATLTTDEVATMASLKQEKTGDYLQLLCEQCKTGDRYCYQMIPATKPTISPEDLEKKLEDIHKKLPTIYGANGAVLLGAVAHKSILPTLDHTIAASMIGYPQTLLASKTLTDQLQKDRALAKTHGVDLDVLTLSRTMIETGQVQAMKAIMLDQAKGTNLNSPTMLQHLANIKVSQRNVLDSLQDPGKEADRKIGASIRTELNLTAFQFPVEGVKDLVILPLANEIASIYKGPDALPTYMLLKLQESWAKEDRNVIIPRYISGSKTKWLDGAVLAVHKNIHEIQDMKNILWTEIGYNPEIENQLPECQKYARKVEFSYIRLVYELRRRLGYDTDQIFLYEAYQKLAQRTGERAPAFVARAASLREQAYCSKTDDDYENLYENPWNQHYEIVLRGFTNKQLMGEINRINPKDMASLKLAVDETEIMFSKNLRMGLVQGQEDPRALVGLPLPSEEVIQQIQELTGMCYNCGDKNHFRNQCPSQEPVCYKCKRPGHIKMHCTFTYHNPGRGNRRGGRGGVRNPNRNNNDRKEPAKINQLEAPEQTESIWTPFAHQTSFHNGSQ